jgi:hypothetical protein
MVKAAWALFIEERGKTVGIWVNVSTRQAKQPQSQVPGLAALHLKEHVFL